MKLTLTIVMDNAAFGDMPGTELARILHDAARRVEDEQWDNYGQLALHDINGNQVGSMNVSD